MKKFSTWNVRQLRMSANAGGSGWRAEPTIEAMTALMLPPSLKAVGIYAVYLLVVFIRPRGLFGSI